jgi:NCS1 family nucleobase:cation symporter-1
MKLSVETRTIQPVPETERHGKPWSLFTLWFSPNLNVVIVIIGSLTVTVGLNFWWAVTAIVVGNLLGVMFMAFHSAQGPKLGLPQMIQSRAQFGSLGNAIPSLAAIVDGLGFTALALIVSAQSLLIIVRMPMTLAILLSGIVVFVVVLIGYDFIHRIQRYLAVVLAALTVLWTVQALTTKAGPAPAYDITAGTFLLAVSLIASSVIGWAPFVADYSRYLPSDTSPSRIFWYTYLGAFLSSVWSEVLGAGLAVVAFGPFTHDGVGYLVGLSPKYMEVPLAIVLILSQISPSVLEVYTPVLTAANLAQPFSGLRWLLSRNGRLTLVAAATAIATGAALWANHVAGFDTDMTNLLLFLIYVLAPWTAINLVDFYVIRHGQYSVAELFKARGAYGLVNWPVMIIYLATIGIEFLFMNCALFEGPVARAMGGADIAWEVAVVVAGGLYYLYRRYYAVAPTVIAESVTASG